MVAQTPHESERTPSRPADDHDALARVLGLQTAYVRDRLGFAEASNEWRRPFAEVLGTFFLVLVAAGAGMVNARFGGHAVGPAAQAVAPGLVVTTMILFMGSVSGAHLNPAITFAFALRKDFPWRRVPGYLLAQALGSVLAVLTLVALVHKQGVAGLTLPNAGVTTTTTLLWELLLSVGLVSTVLGTSSGAQNVGPLNAIGVGAYIALAGLWAAPMSGASMNPDRSLAPALVMSHWASWWAYLAVPLAGAAIAVGFAWILRGPGGGFYGKRAAQGALGSEWQPGPSGYEPGATQPEGRTSGPPGPSSRTT